MVVSSPQKKMAYKEDTWLLNYARLMAYVVEHKQLPDKKKVENRGLLNWWKYNMKLVKQGKMDSTRCQMLEILSNARMFHGLFYAEKDAEQAD